VLTCAWGWQVFDAVESAIIDHLPELLKAMGELNILAIVGGQAALRRVYRSVVRAGGTIQRVEQGALIDKVGDGSWSSGAAVQCDTGHSPLGRKLRMNRIDIKDTTLYMAAVPHPVCVPASACPLRPKHTPHPSAVVVGGEEQPANEASGRNWHGYRVPDKRATLADQTARDAYNLLARLAAAFHGGTLTTPPVRHARIFDRVRRPSVAAKCSGLLDSRGFRQSKIRAHDVRAY
jgi:hypothetical protein